ncbi:MAG: ribonuclease Z, partial [Candidatus Diapherotrites archaeon]|nr:ribonuclease Z [Candidatus Diapherotrites archaeon]
MKLIVLGSGVMISGAHRNCAGYLLYAGKEKFVFDFGTGAFKALQKTGEDFLSVNNFFFSHFDHPDHVNDFVAFVASRYVAHQFKTGKPKTIHVIAPRGFKNFFAKVQEV